MWVQLSGVIMILCSMAGSLTPPMRMVLFEVSCIAENVRGRLVWLVFIGAAALWRKNDHFQGDGLNQALAGSRALPLLNVFAVVICHGNLLS